MNKFFFVTVSLILAACDSSNKDIQPEKIQEKPVVSEQTKKTTLYTREQVLEARKKYTIEVLRFDDKQTYGSDYEKTNLIRVKVTNNSEITLPQLTVMTKRWHGQEVVGNSRYPSLPTSNLKPGETAEFDYYALGALPSVDVDKITIEIEQMLDPKNEQFIKELPKE